MGLHFQMLCQFLFGRLFPLNRMCNRVSEAKFGEHFVNFRSIGLEGFSFSLTIVSLQPLAVSTTKAWAVRELTQEIENVCRTFGSEFILFKNPNWNPKKAQQGFQWTWIWGCPPDEYCKKRSTAFGMYALPYPSLQLKPNQTQPGFGKSARIAIGIRLARVRVWEQVDGT